MNDLEAAAWEVHQFFTGLDLQYAVIGGFAVQHWGEPRFTGDIDLTVAAPLDDPEGFVRMVLERFSPRIDGALEFALQNRVILVAASNGLPLDITLGLPGYEDEMMARAIELEMADGKRIRVCSAEDLVVHKAVAGRAQDIRDIEGVVYRQGRQLDAEYIRRWLKAFSAIVDNPDLAELFEKPWQKLA
ncbi:MAG: nucleotidyltransferase [Chloroflexota bacterium]|jgi:hypothetical protein